MTDNDRLVRFLEQCRRNCRRLRRLGKWPWPDTLVQTEPRVARGGRASRRRFPNDAPRVPRRSEGSSRDRAMMDSPALHFDNSSSGSDLAPELLTTPETAIFLRISISGVRRLQQARQLPFIKVGSGIRFARGDLIAYLAKRRVELLDT